MMSRFMLAAVLCPLAVLVGTAQAQFSMPSDLVIHLDASGGTDVLTDGNGVVTEWQDLMGNISAVPIDGTGVPAYGWTSMALKTDNGYVEPAYESLNPATMVSFGGSALKLPGAATDYLANGDWEIFVAGRRNLSNDIHFLVGGATITHYELHSYPGAPGYYRSIPNGFNSGNQLGSVIDVPDPANDYRLHTFGAWVDDTTAGAGVDGNQVTASGHFSGSGYRSSQTGDLILGMRGSGDYPLYGHLGEVLIFDRALTAQERSDVEGYLMDKWTTPDWTLVKSQKDVSADEPMLDPLYNVALAANGAQPFAQDVYGDGAYAAHQIDHLNNGLYGNAESWLAKTMNSWAGVWLADASAIDAIVLSRDGGGPNDAAGGGEYTFVDRWQGEYIVQYTTDSLTTDGLGNVTNDPATANWTEAMRFTYEDHGYDFLGQHMYEFAPIAGVTGVRVLVSSAAGEGEIAIDELSIRSTTPIPEPSTLALLLGVGLVALTARRRRD